MAKDDGLEQHATERREEPRETRTTAPLPEPVPPLLNEGLERVRESHC